MAMKIITGYTGEKHITPSDDARLNKTLFGEGDYVLPTGNQLEATIVSATEIKVADGELVMQGRYARNNLVYESLAIENGSQGTYRNDLIVARYTKDTSTSVESIELVVITGTADKTSASDPEYNTGDIEKGETRDFPLYRVRLEGLNVSKIESLFNVWAIGDTHIQSIKSGGTGATTAQQARQNINFIGADPITNRDDDTVENWMALGTGVAYISKDIMKHSGTNVASILENNIVEKNGYKYITQTLRPLSGLAEVFHRAGNESGWYSNGKWAKSLDENTGIQIVKLWQNASTSSDFAGQTINDLTADSCNLILAVFNISANSGRKVSAIGIIGWYGEAFWFGNLDTTTANLDVRRQFLLSADGELTFGDCTAKQSNTTKNNNTYLIPYAVYGIKGVQ